MYKKNASTHTRRNINILINKFPDAQTAISVRIHCRLE